LPPCMTGHLPPDGFISFMITLPLNPAATSNNAASLTDIPYIRPGRNIIGFMTIIGNYVEATLKSARQQ